MRLGTLAALLLAGCASIGPDVDAIEARAAAMSPQERVQACEASVSQVETFCRGPGPFYPGCQQSRALLYAYCVMVDKQTACQASLRDQVAQCRAMAIYNPIPPYCSSANKAVSTLCY
jgi:hypothetical protein